jgi:hypothetical protein
MCRSIKTLRAPYTERVTDEDMRAAALQYVRKVSGFRSPAAHNAAAFNQAVDEIAAATRDLLGHLEVRGAGPGGRLPGPARDAPRWSPPTHRPLPGPEARAR